MTQAAQGRHIADTGTLAAGPVQLRYRIEGRVVVSKSCWRANVNLHYAESTELFSAKFWAEPYLESTTRT
jgi:hypothetical protein